MARPARVNWTAKSETLPNPMEPKPRFRLLLLLVAVVALVGLIWLLDREPRKDVTYYFPGWVGPSVSSGDLDRRFRDLTNSSAGVGILFQASRLEPTQAGLLWCRIVEELPAGLGRHLPQYIFPDSSRAGRWLFDHANEAAVARELERQWPALDERSRADWFRWVSRSAVRSQPAYVRFALATPESVDPETRVAAARLLVSAETFGAAEADFVARVCRDLGSIARASNNRANHLLGDLARFHRANPAIVAALASLATNKNSFAGPAALALAALEPAELSHRPRLRSALDRLNHNSHMANEHLADMLTWPEFGAVLGSEWGLGLLADKLVIARKTIRVAGTNQIRVTGPDELWLRVIDSLGTNAAPLSGRLLDLVQHDPEGPKARLAVTFANVAPHSPEHLAAAIPLLSDHEAVAPLLLWLGGAGTAAECAVSAVRAIADDSKHYPPEAGTRETVLRMDPALARRYGLIPAQRPETGKADRGKTTKRPSDIWIPAQSCPNRWGNLWPRARRNGQFLFPELSANARAQLRNSARNPIQVAGTTLRPLAQDCLRRISPEPASEAAKAKGGRADTGGERAGDR